MFKPGEDRVHKLFLDPTGRHLIVSFESQENIYISRNSKKTKPITKLKVKTLRVVTGYDILCSA